MNKEFVLKPEALALKELGFDEPCIACYDKLNMLATYLENLFKPKNYNTSGYCISAPLYQQAFRWFRKKHKLSGIPTHQSYDIYNIETGECIIEVYPLDSYEEAELACLRKLIELVKGGDK